MKAVIRKPNAISHPIQTVKCPYNPIILAGECIATSTIVNTLAYRYNTFATKPGVFSTFRPDSSKQKNNIQFYKIYINIMYEN